MGSIGHYLNWQQLLVCKKATWRMVSTLSKFHSFRISKSARCNATSLDLFPIIDLATWFRCCFSDGLWNGLGIMNHWRRGTSWNIFKSSLSKLHSNKPPLNLLLMVSWHAEHLPQPWNRIKNTATTVHATTKQGILWLHQQVHLQRMLRCHPASLLTCWCLQWK